MAAVDAMVDASKSTAWIGHMTLIFLGCWVVVSLIVGEWVAYTTKNRSHAGYNRGMTWCLAFLAACCMWTLWFCVYMMQLYPLYLPELEHTAKHGIHE